MLIHVKALQWCVPLEFLPLFVKAMLFIKIEVIKRKTLKKLHETIKR